MNEKFIFHGQTTFIDKPRDTVIQNFKNSYISGDNPKQDEINSQILKLIELMLGSKYMPNETKEEAVQALHSVAGQVKEQKANKLTLKGTLQAIEEVVKKAADIAVPALGILSSLFKLLGLA
jgi:tRNA C32,U32 (ribose-2'-O)-methylase TrmJ